MLSKPISGGIEESIFGKEPESTFTITDFLNAEIDASVPERMEAYLATTESEKKEVSHHARGTGIGKQEWGERDPGGERLLGSR